jgi:hypothetical protein
MKRSFCAALKGTGAGTVTGTATGCPLTRPLFVANVISIAEEKVLLAHLNKLLQRRKYEGSHWDDVIQQYKEIEVGTLPSKELTDIVERVKACVTNAIQDRVSSLSALGENPPSLNISYLPMHVIDLAATGHIGKL